MYRNRFLAVLCALAAAAAHATAVAQTPALPPPLLTYAVRPSPEPLQVSRPGALRVVVSNGGTRAVSIQSLVFSIVVGGPGPSRAVSLTHTDRGLGLDGPDGWEFIKLGEGSFRASPEPPATAVEITTGELVFAINNILVDSVMGTTTLTITERAAGEGQGLERRQTAVQLPLRAGTLTAGDLTASRTQVGFRETVTLQWEGTDAAYSILYGKDSVPIPARVRTWTSPPLEQSTTFILVARTQEGGSTVAEHFPITVQVSNPSVLAHDLTVQGPSVLQGTVQAAADLRVATDVRAGGRIYDAGGVVFPAGGIVMWAGRTDQVPQGWVLCDGRNGTPDLRGRFVVGWNPADRDYDNVGETGGAAQVALSVAQLPAHAHAGNTGPAGSHSHDIEGGGAKGLAWRRRNYPGDSNVYLYYGGGSYADPGGVEWRGTARTDNSGGHGHAFTTSQVGDGQPHENRPPYYVLAYIMKL
jgi:microcystin-dependent protein